jgi:hypothetical protein
MQSTFTLTTDIATNPEAAFAFVADMHQLIGGHPLIHSMTLTAATTDPDGLPVRTYEVKETLKLFGFLPVPNKYHFTQHIGQGQAFYCDIASPPVKLLNRYRVEATATGARVVEDVTITAPAWLMGYTRKTAYLAHVAMFERVKAALEAIYGVPSRPSGTP